MQAVILAGGKGTRLRPYTATLPKPLVPVGDFPILEIIIRQLKSYKICDITICTGHLAELIEAFFGNGSRWGVNITYVRENVPLNTAGAIKLIDELNTNFIVMNGDILTTLNYAKLFKFHLEHKGIATISIQQKPVKIDYGIIEIDKNGSFVNYIEKPIHWQYISMGINVMNIKCKDYIKKNEAISIPELIIRMKNSDEKIFCYKSKDYWLDIGRIEDFQLAQEIFKKKKNMFL